MYLIVNISKRDICISDLKISLQPKQAIDLDKVVSRDRSQSSIDLKQCLSSHFIKILQKDGEKIKVKIEEKPQKIVSETYISEEQLKDIKEEIKKEIIKNMQLNVTKSSDSQEVIDKINQLMLLVQQGGNKDLTSNDFTGVKTEDIDYKTLSDIHAKVVNKMTKKAEANVKYEEEKSDNSVSDNASELEDLIG